MNTEVKTYQGKIYRKIDNEKYIIDDEDINDFDLKNVSGHLDVIEIDDEKYVTKDYKLLHKMTPELEVYVYKKGDLDDIIEMHNDNEETGNLPQIREKEIDH